MSTFDDEIEENKRKIAAMIASKPHKPVQIREIRDRIKKVTTKVKIIKLEKRVMELDIEIQRLRDMIRKLEKWTGIPD